MKAIVVREFGAAEVLRLEDVPDPTPGPGQLRVRVHAAGVNPVDTYIRAGKYGRLPSLPYTPGFDYAGVVDVVGAGVARFKVGDRVYGHIAASGVGAGGAYAGMTLATDESAEPLPAALSFQQGAALGIPYGTAWKALFLRAHARAGETVLVHGASGGTGSAAVQIARAAGCRVFGTASTAKGLELVRAQGAHAAFNHAEAGYVEQIMAATGGRGVDVIVEMLANVNLDRDLDMIALRGRISIVGSRGAVTLEPRKIMAREATVAGMVTFNSTADDFLQIHAALVGGLESGALKPAIGKELPLKDAARAHEAVMEPGALGKIVLLP